jgi:hypothetical protein
MFKFGVLKLSSSTNAAHQEALRKEIERLRQVYQQQNLKMDKTNSSINQNN